MLVKCKTRRDTGVAFKGAFPTENANFSTASHAPRLGDAYPIPRGGRRDIICVPFREMASGTTHLRKYIFKVNLEGGEVPPPICASPEIGVKEEGCPNALDGGKAAV